MPARTKATDEEIRTLYEELKSVWKVGDRLGMCGQSVQERLARMKIPRKNKRFSEEEKDVLRREYLKYRDANDLDALAKKMCRTKPFICRQARKLGLTDVTKSYRPEVKCIDSMGYVCVNGKRKYASRHEHRIIAENVLGRPLKHDEVVHHIDKDPTNNAHNNLVIMHNWDHTALHMSNDRWYKKKQKSTWFGIKEAF